MIIVLAQTKGGVGKSTLAINLAIERSRAGRDVLLVDADEQATATDFTALRTQQLGTPGLHRRFPLRGCCPHPSAPDAAKIPGHHH